MVCVKARVLLDCLFRRLRLHQAGQPETNVKKAVDVRFHGSMIFDNVVDEPFGHAPSFIFYTHLLASTDRGQVELSCC